MGRFLNPDNSSFQDVVNSEIYVDKTGLLDYTNSVINTTSKFICNSRPRRFGKSITADMMAAYYSMGCDSRELFMGYDISKKDSFEKYLNKYDVLHLDIQWCIEPAKGPENVVSYIIENTVAELKLAFPDVKVEGRVTLSDMLSQINAQTGKRFIVIIDEWDVLVRDEANNQSVQEEYINFLRGLFKGSSATRYIALAYLTGILPIKKLKTQSALNNFEEFTMISPGGFAHYIGFTEDEVKKLCEKSGRDFELVKKWYDGYLLGEYHIYNPKAVSNVIKWGNFQSSWSQTGTYDSIQPLINKDFDGLKSAIVEMISGAETEVKTTTFQNDMVTFRNKNDVMTLLIHLGYLAYDQKRQMAYIPNEEIRMEFMNAVEDDKWNELIEFETQSERLLEATLDMEEKVVAEYIDKIHNEYASAIQYHNENSLSSVLAIGYISAMKYYFKPVREMPTGRGFADFVFIPKQEYVMDYPALVVELKWNKDVKTAINQIKDRQYPQSVLQYTGNILLVGINYDKKTKVHECIIEELVK